MKEGNNNNNNKLKFSPYWVYAVIITILLAKLTPEGYAVESEFHPGSVQIYPAGALELIETAMERQP